MPDSRPKRFFDLGFYPGTAEPSKELPLGGKKGNVGLKNPSGRAPKNIGLKRILWQVISWVLLASGIFLRQALDIPVLVWHPQNLTLGAFAASVVISFALFPVSMRQLNKFRPEPGVAQIAAPFAFGFFLDLVRVSTYHWFKGMPLQ
jgi:hypothetical protein